MPLMDSGALWSAEVSSKRRTAAPRTSGSASATPACSTHAWAANSPSGFATPSVQFGARPCRAEQPAEHERARGRQLARERTPAGGAVHDAGDGLRAAEGPAAPAAVPLRAAARPASGGTRSTRRPAAVDREQDTAPGPEAGAPAPGQLPKARHERRQPTHLQFISPCSSIWPSSRSRSARGAHRGHVVLGQQCVVRRLDRRLRRSTASTSCVPTSSRPRYDSVSQVEQHRLAVQFAEEHGLGNDDAAGEGNHEAGLSAHGLLRTCFESDVHPAPKRTRALRRRRCGRLGLEPGATSRRPRICRDADNDRPSRHCAPRPRRG